MSISIVAEYHARDICLLNYDDTRLNYSSYNYFEPEMIYKSIIEYNERPFNLRTMHGPFTKDL